MLLDYSNRFSVGKTSVKMIFEFILFLGIIDLEKSDKWLIVLEISYRKLEEKSSSCLEIRGSFKLLENLLEVGKSF